MTMVEDINALPKFNAINLAEFQSTLHATLDTHIERIQTILLENTRYTWENLIQPLEDMDDELERLWSPIAHLHAAMNSDALRNCYEACLPKISAYESAVGQNVSLYEAIKSIEIQTLDKVQQKIISDNLVSFQG